MPNWKKLIVSGSDANLNSLNIAADLTASNALITDDLDVQGNIEGAGLIQVENTLDNHIIGKLIIDYGSSNNPRLNSVGGTEIDFNTDLVIRSNKGLYSDTSSTSGLIVGSQRADTPIKFLTSPTTNSTYSEAMRIAGDGKVGIGTTNPQALLNIKHPNSGGEWIRLERDGQRTWDISADDQSGNKDFSIKDVTAGTRPFIIHGSTGNIGIGTDTPSEKLEVAGNARITGDVTLSNGNALRWTSDDVRIEGTTAGDNIKFYVANTEILELAQSGTLATVTGNLIVSSSSSELAIGPAAGKSRIFTNSSKDIRFSTATTSDAVFIKNNNGNVGIGTTSPSEKLHVVGYVKTSIGLKAGNYTILNESSNETSLSNTAYYPMFFKTNNSTRMTISNAGNVGIGTTSPSQKLQVVSDSIVIADFTTTSTKGGIKIAEADEGGFLSTEANRICLGSAIGVSANNLTYHMGTNSLGIGTSSPLNRLQVTGGSVGIDSEYMIRDNRNNTILLQSASTVASNRSLTIGNATYSNIIVPNGNVGIGTTSPSEKLHIAGNMRLQNQLYDSTNSQGSTGQILSKVAAGTQWAYVSSLYTETDTLDSVTDRGATTTNDITIGNLEVNNQITTPTDTDLKLHPNGSGHLYLGNAGNGMNMYHYSQQDNGKYTTFTHHGTYYRISPNATSGLEITTNTKVSGDLTVTGKVTAQEFHTEFVSASIMYESGSTKFGDTSDDLHSFTGSLIVQSSGSAGSNKVALRTSAGLDVVSLTNNNSDTFPVGSVNISYGSGTAGQIVGNSNKLKIRGGSNSTGEILFTNGAAGADELATINNSGIDLPGDNRHIYFGGNNTFIGERSNSTNLELRGGGNTVAKTVYINSEGSLGIGTASPSEKLTVEGNISASGDFYVDGAIFDTSNTSGTSGQVLSSTATGTAWIDTDAFSSTSSEAILIAVKNTSGGAINEGTPVYETGTVGATETLTVSPADASDSTKMPAIGILTSTLNNNGQGYAIVTGIHKGITTSPIDGVTPTTNTTLYVKAGGGLTTVKPTGASNLIQNVGKVGKVSGGSAGSIVVSSIMRSNDIPNLPEGKIWVGSNNYSVTSSLVHLDEPNERLGIGTTSPTSTLHVNGGTGALSTGLTFGDGDTGIWEASDDNLRFSTVSSTRMIITSAGNVGIGTLSPGQKLDVNGSINVSSNVFAEGFYGDRLWNSDNAALRFGTNNTERARINGNGNVGIGTTNPGQKLDVDGSIRTNSNLFVYNSDLSKNILKVNAEATTNTGIFKLYNGVNWGLLARGESNSPSIGSFYGGSLNITGFEDSAGGTTSTIKLARFVFGGTGGGSGYLTLNGDLNVNNNKKIKFGYGNSQENGIEWISGSKISAAITPVDTANFSRAGLGFFTGDFSDGTTNADERMRITRAGNVGIGTTSPSFPLDVDTTSARVRFKALTGSSTLELSAIEGRDWIIQSKDNGKFLIYDEDATASRLFIDTDGSIGLPAYGSGTFTGTAAYTLGVDSSGNIIETDEVVTGTGTKDKIAIWSDTDTLSSSGSFGYNNRTLQLNDANYTAIQITAGESEHNTVNFVSGSSSVGRVGWHKQGYFASSAMNVNPSPALMLHSNNGIDLMTSNTGSLSIKSGSADVIIDSKVNLGIGIASPTHKLHVVGDIKSTNKIFVEDSSNSRLEFASSISNQARISAHKSNLGQTLPLLIQAEGIKFGTVGGGEKMRMDASGRLLLNATTTAFNDKLYINSDAYATGGWRVGTSATYVGKLINDGGKLTLMSDGSRDVQIGNNNNPSMLYVDTSEEKVGIGTASPGAKLHVYNAGTSFIKIDSDSTAPYMAGVEFLRSSINGGRIYNDGGAVQVKLESYFGYDATNPTRGGFMFKTAPVTSGTLVDAVRIDARGYVGIGTTTPTRTLDVRGGAILAGDTPANPVGGTLEIYKNGADSILTIHEDAGTHNARLRFRAGGNDTYIQNTPSTFEIRTEGNLTSGTAPLKITSNGDVTLGYDLTVEGSVTAREFHTEFVSASIMYESGSTKFGDTSDDTHDFTGSLNVLNGNLTVEGDGVRQINLESSNSEVRLGLKGNNGNQFRFTSDGTYFRLNDATKERIKITNAGDTTFGGRDSGGNQSTWMTLEDQTGNVGIGTTSPGYKLDVEGDVGFSDWVYASKYYPVSSTTDILIQTGAGRSIKLDPTSTGKVVIPNGNVGIGTTSPSFKLHVDGGSAMFDTDSGNNPLYIARNSSTSEALKIYVNDTEAFFESIQDETGGDHGRFAFKMDGDSPDAYTRWLHGTTERMRLTAGGNLGIGTTTPDTIMEILGANPILTIRDSDTSTSTATSTIRFAESNASDTLGNYWDVGYSPVNLLNFDFNGSTKMTINSSGNVGIGIDSPDAILHLKGSTNTTEVKIDTDDNALGDDAFIKFNGARAQVGWIDAAVTLTDGGGNKDIKLKVNTGSIFLQTNNTNRLTVADGGNVGIGTTNPSAKLDIEGDLQVKGVNISNQENLDIDTGTETIATVVKANYDAAFFDFVIKNGTNLRAGTVFAIHDGTNVEFTETSTNDLGDTSDVTLSVDISGTDMRLRATTTSDNWVIKSLVRTI